MTGVSSEAHMALRGGIEAQKGEAKRPRPARQLPCHRAKETKSNTVPRVRMYQWPFTLMAVSLGTETTGQRLPFMVGEGLEGSE